MATTKKRRGVGASKKPAGDVVDTHVTRLQKIVSIMEASSLFTLEYEDADIEVRLTRGAPALAAPAPAPVAVMTAAPPAPPVEEVGVAFVRSPIVGTFYRAPSPTARAFVEVGHAVRRGQALCIVEAMKLMNEIEADVSGRVVEIMVENGEAVQYDQPLFKIAVDP